MGDAESQFLLDTVTLVKLTRAQLRSKLVRGSGIIIEEVEHEFRDSTKAVELTQQIAKVDVELLRKVGEILLQPTVQRLLKLYDCEGNGDVLLLAKALIEKERGELELFPRKWVIVTDDTNLTTAAHANGISTLSTQAFTVLI